MKALIPLLLSMLSRTHGEAYGGPGFLVLAMRHYASEMEEADRGLFLVLPALGANELERTFREAEFRAEYHDPIPAAKAALERGRVTVRRISPESLEFELFLVLKRAGSAERFQVITRVDAPVSR
jgi:hypothetical protein